ncbi:hypothetical protein [Kordiimonas aquimaris]|uniref:hypothetical protein n=1 Tax=Kordiimonas aquimaris TaxID=707591 RepID=UPI0021D29F78|nr:hypothetical protein [Kordiimonas aquimaris]
MTLNNKDYMTIAGALMVAVGAFSPMINISGLKTVTYADAADPQVYVLVILALVAGGLIFAGKQSLSMFAALGAWIVLLWPVLKNIGPEEDGGLLGKVTDAAADPLQTVAQKLFSNVLNFEWGGYVFLIGMLLVLIGSVMLFLDSRKT